MPINIRIVYTYIKENYITFKRYLEYQVAGQILGYMKTKLPQTQFYITITTSVRYEIFGQLICIYKY
jgi:hypothetical protein